MPSFADEIDKELLAYVEIIGLPSTSFAHAALSSAAKIDALCAALSKRCSGIRTGNFQVYRVILKH
jgi:regulator of sigma D